MLETSSILALAGSLHTLSRPTMGEDVPSPFEHFGNTLASGVAEHELLSAGLKYLVSLGIFFLSLGELLIALFHQFMHFSFLCPTLVLLEVHHH